jgi:hypothetical protein
VGTPRVGVLPTGVNGVDLMADHRAEIDLAFTQFFYRHLGLSQTED